MHFRERGPSIQIIRSTYDQSGKRSKNEVLGRMSRATLRVPDDVLTKLSAAEKTELATYVERAKSLDLLRRKLTAHVLPQTIAEAIDYAHGVEDEAERDLLQAHFAEAIVALRRASRSGKAEAA